MLELMTRDEVARVLRVNVRTVDRYIKEGLINSRGHLVRLVAAKAGSSRRAPVRIKASSVRAFVDQLQENTEAGR